MTQFDNLKLIDLERILKGRGMIVQNIRKSFLSTLLNHLETGNLHISLDQTCHNKKNDTLKERIAELEDELYNTSLHLNRTKDNCETYKSLALEAEESFIKKIEDQKITINQLKLEVANFKTYEFSHEDSASYEKTIRELNQSLELKTLVLNTQKQEIEELNNKLHNIREQLARAQVALKSISNVSKITQTQNQPEYQPTRSRILFVADSQGRNCGSIIRNIMDCNKYDTCCFFKPNATFEIVAESACELSANYGKNDHVIILAGSNNALKNQQLTTSYLEQLKQKMSHTKLTILLTPLWYGNIKLNSIILQNNITLCAVFRNTTTIVNTNSVLSTFDYTSKGLHINYVGKVKLLKYTYMITIQPENNLSIISSKMTPRASSSNPVNKFFR